MSKIKSIALTTAISIIILLIPIAIAYGALNEKVSNLEKTSEQSITNSQNIAVMKESLNNIDEKLDDIKIDIKEIKEDVKNG